MSFDRHPYLKHSTAAPYMPAHKDTPQPAGQVVNEDKGLSSLSEYIRSINRAQAFDDIARELAEKAHEKKLTFDEWWTINGIGGQGLYEIAKESWYAALKHGKVS